VKLAFSQDLRKMDALAVGRFNLTIAQLMQRAGEAVVEKVGPLSKKKIGVVCGKGNNGGDGLVAARLLKKRKIDVRVVLAQSPEIMGKEAAAQYRKAKAAKVSIITVESRDDLRLARTALEKCDLLIDALLGTGLSRPAEGLTRDLILLMNDLKKPLLAVDTPSGFSMDAGVALGEAVKAQWTVTLGLSKVGFYTPSAAAYTGEVSVNDLGLPEELLNADFLKVEMTDPALVRKSLPRYDDNINKGTRGRVLVVAGSTGLTGAAALSAWGAQRIGAGLVTVACAGSLNPILAAKLTECMTAPVAEAPGGFISFRASARILELAAKAKALVIGPGLGQHEETGRLLQEILPRLAGSLVLDADALNLLSSQEGLWKALSALKAPVILTPHPGEAARLLKITIAEVEQNRLKVAKQIAAEYNAVAVLKGRHTVIANPQGDVRVNPTGNRGLATGGTGDVLSGILGGLLAQGLSAFDAASTGVYLHGLAGEKASRRFGPDGLLATDLLPILPRLLRQVREKTLEPPCLSTPHSKPNGKRSSN
jgi:hydroxyethylthiazole kinase-like uncharacterized protein yjeF